MDLEQEILSYSNFEWMVASADKNHQIRDKNLAFT